MTLPPGYEAVPAQGAWGFALLDAAPWAREVLADPGTLYVVNGDENDLGATPDTGKPNVDKNIVQVERHLRDYKDRLRIVKDGEVMQNVSIKCCPGHTPGHSAWIIHSGKESAMMWGDTIHLQNVQMVHPEVATIYDLDGELGARSRKMILDMCIADGINALGAHLDFPGFARVVKKSSGYGFEYDF